MRRRGFTMIELLVSMALMAFLLTTATYAFTQVKKMTARIQARQTLHNTARIVYERLRFDIDSMHQGTAFYLRSGGAAGPVELVFMRGKLDNGDFTIEDRYGFDTMAVADHVWTRWAWVPDREQIEVSESTGPNRQFQLTSHPSVLPAWSGYLNQYFALKPYPRRLAGTGPATLDESSFGTGHPKDYGDYTDLVRESTPIALNCSDFSVEVILQDGSAIAASASGSSNQAINGILVDGSADGERRPRLVRLRFTLSDARLDLQETFSFSFLAPGLLPQ